MYDSTVLSPRHSLDFFDCGKDSLNIWLSKYARHAQQNRTARTFVWTEEGHDDVIAYYTLAGHVVEQQILPKKVGRPHPARPRARVPFGRSSRCCRR